MPQQPNHYNHLALLLSGFFIVVDTGEVFHDH